jgi:hypothetical protein
MDLCRDQSRLAMLTALVPLCSIAVTPDLTDCAVKNAAVVVRVPGEFGHPVNCFMQAQAFWLQLPSLKNWDPMIGLKSFVVPMCRRKTDAV